MRPVEKRLLTAAILFPLILLACTRKTGTGDGEKKLFRLVPPSQSGITFANMLRETDSMNCVFYEYYYNGSGLAAGDLNRDGLTDLVFGSNMTKSAVYLNRGSLKFEDITNSCGINTSGKWITGVSIEDINLDGWPDIYLCAAGNINYDYHNLLYISNGDPSDLKFKECAALTGLDDNGYSTQALFFDYDRDGDLDVYMVTAAMLIPNKNALRPRKDDGSVMNTDRLYRNDGINPSTGLPVFHNVSREAGITWDGFGLGAAVCDINRDGWPDIYVGNDYISNDLLYVNQLDGTFSEMLQQYTGHISNSTMGVDIADFNNDGLVDILTLDMQPENYLRKRTMAMTMRDYHRYLKELEAGYSPQYIRNMLQLNNGNTEGRISFSEIGQLAGIFETDWSWAPLFADFDNDGYKDLFIGNGIPNDVTNMDISELWMKTMREKPGIPFPSLYKLLKAEMDKVGNIKKPNVIFRNTGSYRFENTTNSWGLERPSYSAGNIFADLDNDGDLDLILNNINEEAFVYENNTITDTVPSDRNYLSLILKGDTLNRNGIGAKISLWSSSGLQYYEHFPIRGFQSMVDPVIHFGLGADSVADSLAICWPDGQVEQLRALKVNQALVLDYKNSRPALTVARVNNPPFFTGKTGKYGISYKHEERQFIDFDVQPLMPHLYSREGPGIAVGDINSDGLDDFFIGGSTGFPGYIWLQGKNGSFSSSPLPDNTNYEDMGACLFDSDGDGDNDLYVVSGGPGLPPGNAFYADRLYLNDGHGSFSRDAAALPDERVCGSQVIAADYDHDGDPDLFVCGRINLENYPTPPRSFLLRNDSKGKKVKFTDVTASASEKLLKPGLVASALWTDFDRDGSMDLILAGEWMPLTFFRNDKGKFTDVTEQTGLKPYTGWWNSIAAADLDEDGDMDYIAGNLGLNTQYKVSSTEPMRIYARDFDMNGSSDPVCTYYVQGKEYPIYHRNLLLSQIPSLRQKVKSYTAYGMSGFSDLFSSEELRNAYIRDFRYSATVWIENLGNGQFSLHELPQEAQVSPVFGILTGDYDSDGHQDIILTGNSYSSNVYTGQYDASTGLYLQGDGKGHFSPVPGRLSGFFADGDTKGVAGVTLADGSSLLLVAINSDTTRVIKTLNEGGCLLRPGKDDASADLTFSDGHHEYLEFYYGSGYLTQTTRIAHIPAGVTSVKISNWQGKSREAIGETRKK